jgi:hypothetical protein
LRLAVATGELRLVGRLRSRVRGAEFVAVEVLLDPRSWPLLVVGSGVGAADNAFLDGIDGLLRMLLGSFLVVIVVVGTHTPSVCVGNLRRPGSLAEPDVIMVDMAQAH